MALSNNLYQINPDQIDFDKFNPRGETVEQIINDDEFHKLKESIARRGVLVPLIVKRNLPESSKEYLLIDGERRLRASMDLKLETIPVRVVENDVEGKIIAYEIHQNRKAWSKPSEAKSIKNIIDSIKSEDPQISETELKKRLIEITSHKASSINDILKILKFDDDTQDKTSKGLIDHSYLIRIEDDFIAPIKRTYPEIFNTFSEDEIRVIMIRKAELRLLINTRYMMSSNFKNIFKPTLLRNKIILLIIDFLESPEKSISDLYIEFEELEPTEKIKENMDNSNQNNFKVSPDKSISNHNSQNTISPPMKEEQLSLSNPQTKKTTNTIQASGPSIEQSSIIIPKIKKADFNAIKESLEKFGKQYSEEELEYIKEAIVCLGSEKALKASVLMIWSSSISRILKYIEKDIPKFNNISDTMQSNKKSFYKYYCGNFQKNASSIEEIKELAKDMQLLCYLCYEGIITQSQFKQLKGHYDLRNECAHPTSLKLSMNEVLAIFENLIKFIFNNPKLK